MRKLKTGDKLNVANDFQCCSIIFKFRNISEQINGKQLMSAGFKTVGFKLWQKAKLIVYFYFETISN